LISTGAARVEATTKVRQNNPTTIPNTIFLLTILFLLLSWNLKIVFAKIPQPRFACLQQEKNAKGSGIIPPFLILLLF
jgi:hypothetical protein